MITVLSLVLQYSCLHAQSEIPWDGKYQLQFWDFQSPATEIGNGNSYSLHGGAGFDFAFHMSNGEFMFTKNFNAKVNCRFGRSLAALVAPDSARAMDILLFARYDFDLAELYARKVRQRLYEVKGAFSSPTFFQPVFNQFQQEFGERRVLASKQTELGHDRDKLQELHTAVLQEIETLADFCKECKPPRKKRK